MASPKKNKKNKKNKAVQQQAAKTAKAGANKASAPKVNKDKDPNQLFLLIAALLIAGLTYFTYSGALDNDFVDWDDFTYVIENDLVRSATDIELQKAKKTNPNIQTPIVPSPHTTSTGDVFKRVISLNYHPLTILTMRWNNNTCPECEYGISARPFIQWNIFLHILNSILVLLIIYWMSKKNLFVSIFVALVFALHPMHVESVAWVSERKDVLYTFFFLAGLLTYTKYLDNKSLKWLLMTAGLFVLSCLAKAMAVVFPLVMVLFLFAKNKSDHHSQALVQSMTPPKILHVLPFLGISLFFGLMASSVQAGGDFGGLIEKSSNAVAINDFKVFGLWQRFQFACYGFLQYLIKFFAPTHLCTFYPYPTQEDYDNSLFFMLAPFVVLLLLALTLFSLKKTKNIVLGMGFYFVTIVLVLQFVSVGAVIMADRYTYLPYIGFAFMLAMLIYELLPENKHKIAYGILIGCSLLFIPKSQSQVETWQDSETLWTNVIDLHMHDNKILRSNMEQPLSIRGNYYGKKSEKAKSPKERMRYIDLAFNDFEKAAQLQSKRPDVYEGIGNTYGMRGQKQQEQAQQLQQQGNNQKADQLKALSDKNFAQAIANYSLALKYNPNKGSTYFNRGVTNSILGKHQEAIEDYTKVLTLSPQQAPSAYLNRGIAYTNLGKKTEAIADFEKALQYNPNQQIAKDYLAQLRAM